MDDFHRFKREIERFLERSRMTPTTFGKVCLNDGSFIADLRKGERLPTVRTLNKVRTFIKEWRPPKKGQRPLEPSVAA